MTPCWLSLQVMSGQLLAYTPPPKHMTVKWVAMIANPQEETVYYPLEHFQSGAAKCLGGSPALPSAPSELSHF